MEHDPVAVTCFDIGGTFLRYGLRSDDGDVPEAGRSSVPRDDWDAFVGAVREGVEATGGDAVSISITGCYDPETGLAASGNLPCIDGRYFERELSELLDRPVLVTNDADAFALAEAFEGAGVGKSIVFAVILGTGVGGGIVANGDIVRGHGGVAGEWGHGPVMLHGPGGPDTPAFECGCGRVGCLDVVGSARGLENIDAALNGARRTSDMITAAWEAGEAEATAAIAYYLDIMSRQLAMVVNTVGPSVIPVAGGLSNATRLMEELDRAVRAKTYAKFAEPLIVPAKTRNGLIGASHAARLAGLT